MKGWWWSGIAEKSGHTSQLKMCECRMRMVSGVACLHRRLAQLAHRVDHQRQRGDVVEVRMVRKTWSIRANSSSVRSPTPVPQSIRDVVVEQERGGARLRPPIPPLHPSTFESWPPSSASGQPEATVRTYAKH